MSISVIVDSTALQEAAKRIRDEMGPEVVTHALGVAVGKTRQFAVDTVAAQVSALYNISAAEVKASAGTEDGVMGVSYTTGTGGMLASITFSGRKLTLDHFDFSPGTPPPTRSGYYAVVGEIYRGSPKVLGGSNFFVPRGGLPIIPFERTGPRRFPIKSVRTVSIPQMILNENLKDPITEAINTHLFDAFMEQFGKE